MSYFVGLEKYLQANFEHKVELSAETEGDEVRFWLAGVFTREGKFLEKLSIGMVSTGAFHAIASLQSMVKGELDAPKDRKEDAPSDSPSLCVLRDTGIAVLDIAAVNSVGFSCEVWYKSGKNQSPVCVSSVASSIEEVVLEASTAFMKRIAGMRTWDSLSVQ